MVIASKDKDVLEKGKPSASRRQSTGVSRPKPGMVDRLAGEAKGFKTTLKPFLPPELIGGSIPYIPGTENEAVWNAASQACATEKVHYVYSIDEGRVVYLACPSSAMASAPDSWCPLAAALPGNSEYWDKETVYIYEQEGLASALRWDPDTGRMQVFLGAARTLLPRIQSMDANFVTINAEVADIIAWRQRQLNTEKLSRASARLLLLVGIAVNFILMAILAFQFVLTNTVKRDLVKAKDDTARASEQLMVSAYGALQSDVIKHMVRIQELIDELRQINGTLVKYQVEKNKVKWEALVPAAYGAGVASIKGEVQPGIESDGRVRIVGTK